MAQAEAVATGAAVQPSAAQPITILAPEWVSKPDGDDLARAFPRKAVLARQSTGAATISCAVAKTGKLEDCTVIEETPAGFDFGLAALQLQRQFKLRAKLKDGQSTEGGRVRIPIHFWSRF